MRKFRFAAVGDNCIDKYLSLGVSRVGGNALNVAVHFADGGHEALYFGAVGDDPDGEWTRKVLNDVLVDTRHLELRPEITAYTDIAHTASGDRCFLLEEFGASAAYHPSESAITDLCSMDHVHFGLLTETDALCARLRGHAPTLSVDCAVNKAHTQMDIAFGSVGEDLKGAQTELTRLLDQGHRLVVVTRGAQGAIASDGRQNWSVSGERIEPVDTTGAGDTFIANFIASWKSFGEVQSALEFATRAAAATCLHLGGFRQVERPVVSGDKQDIESS